MRDSIKQGMQRSIYHLVKNRRRFGPRGSTLDHAGCRAASARAVQPLQAPRAWSWRFIRCQRRRRQVRYWQLRADGRVAEIGRLSPSGDNICLGVNHYSSGAYTGRLGMSTRHIRRVVAQGRACEAVECVPSRPCLSLRKGYLFRG